MKNIMLLNLTMMVYFILLEAVDPCSPPCNADGATGEVCDGGTCICGEALCDISQICNGGVCRMYLKSKYSPNIINTEL